MTITNNTLLNIQGQSLSLKRFPANQFDKSLRAWDAADEYMIDHVANTYDLSKMAHIVIVNDSFGALTCAMAKLAPLAKISIFTDSYMSEQGILQNLSGSNLDKNNVRILSSLDISCLGSKTDNQTNEAQVKDNTLALCQTNNAKIDLVLLKVPRTLSYLKYLLVELRKIVCNTSNEGQSNPQSSPPMVSAAMVKLVTSSALKIFDSSTAQTTTSLARKKSRLIFSQFESEKRSESGEDLLPTHLISDDAIPFTLYNYPNVFCREQVDIGARYMLKSLPKIMKDNQVVVDLGCGNGILGTSILKQYAHKSPKMIYIDESYMAIASAKATLANSDVGNDEKTRASFIVGHCLSALIEQHTSSTKKPISPTNQKMGNQGVDIVICNPPFHQQNTVIDDIAWQMFVDAKKVLKVGGELRIVGNRHLDHRAKLSKLFGGCNVVASDKKFVVLSAIKQA